MLANRSKDLKDTFLGFCDAMITMTTLFVGGDVGLLGSDYNPEVDFDRKVVLMTNLHATLGTMLILNLIGFRMTVARAGDANMQACCMAMQPWYALICVMLCTYIFSLLAIFAVQQYMLTGGHFNTFLTYWLVTAGLFPFAVVPMTVFPRLISQSGAMDDTTAVLHPSQIARGPGATHALFSALGEHALANSHKDFGEVYPG